MGMGNIMGMHIHIPIRISDCENRNMENVLNFLIFVEILLIQCQIQI